MNSIDLTMVLGSAGSVAVLLAKFLLGRVDFGLLRLAGAWRPDWLGGCRAIWTRPRCMTRRRF